MSSNFEDDLSRAHQHDVPPLPPPQDAGHMPAGAGYGFARAEDAQLGPEPTRTSSKAIASAILGIFSLAGMLLLGPFSLVTAFVGLPLGWSARKEIRRDPAVEGDTWALTGIITSWIGIAFVAILVILAIIFLVLGVALFSTGF